MAGIETRSPAESELAAAAAVCRVLARVRLDDDVSPGVLVNTFGFNDFPDDVKAWDASIGPHVFYPLFIMAAHALGRDIPANEQVSKWEAALRALGATDDEVNELEGTDLAAVVDIDCLAHERLCSLRRVPNIVVRAD